MSVQLISWNTQWCRGLDGVVSPRRIVEHARALADFDLLCLQEVADGFDQLPGGPGAQPHELAALLPGFRLFFGAAVDRFTPEGRRQRFGNLIATRLPVLDVAQHRLPCPPDAGVPAMARQCCAVTVQAPGIGPLRGMTTHLAYHSARQRLAQAVALRAPHQAECALAACPPAPGEPGSPFAGAVHTPLALLCGDFNAGPQDAAYGELLRTGNSVPNTTPSLSHTAPAATYSGATARIERWHDAWPLAHGGAPHAPTFGLYDSTWTPAPMACDFVLLSSALAPRLRSLRVDDATQASDHSRCGCSWAESPAALQRKRAAGPRRAAPTPGDQHQRWRCTGQCAVSSPCSLLDHHKPDPHHDPHRRTAPAAVAG